MLSCGGQKRVWWTAHMPLSWSILTYKSYIRYSFSILLDFKSRRRPIRVFRRREGAVRLQTKSPPLSVKSANILLNHTRGSLPGSRAYSIWRGNPAFRQGIRSLSPPAAARAARRHR